MSNSKIPLDTISFLELVKSENEDVFEVNTNIVGTPEYWKRAGVIELIRYCEELLGYKLGRKSEVE